jgi:integrase
MRAIMSDHLQYVRTGWRVQYKVPARLRAIIGRKTLTGHTGVYAPQDDEPAKTEARKASHRIIADIQDRIAAAERELRGEPEPRYIHISDPVFDHFGGGQIMRSPQTKRFVAGVEVPMDFDLVAHLKRTVPMQPSGSGGPVPPELVIRLWKNERTGEGRPPKPKAETAIRRKLERMFAWLTDQHLVTSNDMPAVRPEHAQAYKEYLVPLGIAYDHLTDLRSFYSFAVANRKSSFPNGNPFAEIHVPKRPPHTPRKPFTDEEACKILVDARQREPLIRWGQWLAAFTGTITEEIVEARKSDFDLKDGIWIWDFTDRRGLKTLYRPRGIPLHPSLLREGLIDWLDGLPPGLIFQTDATRASAALMEHIRGLGIENMRDEAGNVVAEKVHYSWRHGFCTQLEDLTTPDRARFLAGHAAKDIHAKHYLHHELPKLADAIKGLCDPTVEKALIK